MFSYSYRERYASALAEVLDILGEVKSSKLLQAYATFSAMQSVGGDLAEAYKMVCEKYKDYKLAVLTISSKCFAKEKLAECAELFTSLEMEKFLGFVVPDIVCEPDRLWASYRQYRDDFAMDQIQLAHHIIAVKLNTYQKILGQAGTQAEDAWSKIYRHYRKNEVYPLPQNIFKSFYAAINMYQLEQGEVSPQVLSYLNKPLADLLVVLFEDLQLTRAQSIKVVRDFFCLDEQAVRIEMGQEIYNFVQNKDHSARAKLINKALKLIAKISPLELICAISLRKKEGVANERRKTEALVVPNDVSLENGMVCSLFFSEISAEKENNLLILFPTPHFVRKVLREHQYENLKITFVFQDGNIAEALAYQASDVAYAPAAGANITFESYSDWKKPDGDWESKYNYALVFGTRVAISERESVCSMLAARCCSECPVFVLDSGRYAESKTACTFDNEDITIQKIALIPQGINNSSQPRRKVLMRCAVNYRELEDNVQVYTYTINTVLKTQALSPTQEAPVIISREELWNNTQTLRKLYSLEMVRRHTSGRERNPPFSQEITPDIMVWCSKTYPGNNRARPRLEAYVCEPAPASKINSGAKERGNRIASTVKHTTRVADEDILDWLENTYPYSAVSPKSSGGKTQTNIREEIISHYTEYLQGENIALKTLWYLYPNLSDFYSKSMYEMLSEMMQTTIGQQKVGDLTVETCEYLLVSEYPQLTQDGLWIRMEILSKVLDCAVELGYCEDNNLRQALRQAHVRDKLFAQVRRALAKKHFTRSELQRAYEFLFSKLEQKQYQYLGVLIRLATGLESKIVCALRWSDLLYYADYNLYSIIVARQINDDGTFEGFRDSEDYLTFPLPQRLQDVLLKAKQQQGVKNGNQLILNSLLSEDYENIGVIPKMLNQLTREMVKSIGIDERIVSLPGREEQSRETDLNKYNGDIIRENFRFWATKVGELNADEMSYLMRNKPTSTLGCYYCDFLNETSQLILRVKLNRIDAASHSMPAHVRRYTPCTASDYSAEIAADEAGRKTVLLELCSEEEASVEVNINSLYGVSYEAALEEEGK